MPLVLDASIALKLVVEEPGTNEAVAILQRPEPRIAPDWILIEIAAALWNKVKYSRLLEVHAQDSLDGIPEFFDELVSSTSLLKSAFALSFQLRHPVYDCLYLALAIEQTARVVTADRDFAKAAERAKLGAAVELLEWREEKA